MLNHLCGYRNHDFLRLFPDYLYLSRPFHHDLPFPFLREPTAAEIARLIALVYYTAIPGDFSLAIPVNANGGVAMRDSAIVANHRVSVIDVTMVLRRESA